jgi:hypothetical protein
MKIEIQTIPHKQQRYETPGDWFWKGDTLFIRTSELGDWRMSISTALHEMVEALLCKQRNIPVSLLDKFDKQYEIDRERGKYTLEQQPGEDPDAPYKREHFFADIVERLFCNELGVDWNEYNNKSSSLSQ